MKINEGRVRLSASDLSNHLACSHLTSLDLAVATGSREAPTWQSPDAWILQQRGLAHETAYVEHLKAQGLAVADLRTVEDEVRALESTRMAMRDGVDVIVQAVLTEDGWFGKSDVLRKVATPSDFGDWSYEAYDCKLALETKATTILQLSLYSELVAGAQGISPEFMHVVTPKDDLAPETYRVLDYAAYYRYVKQRLSHTVEKNGSEIATYPEPTAHCEVCRWWKECDGQRRRDDHLSFVAGLSRLQEKQLCNWDVKTVARLAVLPLPLEQRPERGSKEGYVRIREQARVQVDGRTKKAPIHEILTLNDEHGFYLLPEPSAGDIFFDLESDPFVDRGGREYLFGVVAEAGAGTPSYDCRWAMAVEEEKRAFEWFVDLVMDRLSKHPGMHVYHFSGYEPGALKRLMGRYATREDEIDRILRGRVLVDLHTVLKRALRASVEQYSLKALEPFYGFERKVPLEDARTALRLIQHGLELKTADDIHQTVRDTVQTYNADDCFSTLELRNWLERERAKVEAAGHPIPRPALSDGVAPDKVNERQERSAELGARLREGTPEDPQARSEDQSARWLLSHLLDWHRREVKADWWEYYRLGDLSDEDLLYERSGLAGLRFVERLGVERKIPTDRYCFERQETDVRTEDELCAKGEKFGEVVAIDMIARTADVKKTKKTADVHPTAVYVNDIGPNTDVLADALFRLGSWVNINGIDSPGAFRAARDLLLRRSPRLREAVPSLIGPGEETVDAAKRLGLILSESVLAIQGPPGAGKTYTGSHMIIDLVRQGKKVGITGTSHKVIRNLLDEVIKTAATEGFHNLQCVQKVKEKGDDVPGIVQTTDNAEPLAALRGGAHVVAGTSWLWAREDYFESVDVLFIDEAGQMSLANVLAIAQAAKNIVLLGDPQQLEQPLRGSHPEGAGASALEHLLDGARTIPPTKGLFLEKTWRMHPRLCEFTSEAFYEGRLQSHADMQNQKIMGHPWLGENGLWYIPVQHEGNQNSSPEEVDAVAELVGGLIQPGIVWTNDKKKERPLTLDDILIVAPYNAQVSDLMTRLPNARIGTVDKFQGQQAPVVVYSLTTSSPEDAPRGMEFLYSLNRLNVATSRAQALVIVVASPRLLQPECRSPRQMQLANALCRYAELAHFAKTTATQGAPHSTL
jgi:predicted RecB family nuclease